MRILRELYKKGLLLYPRVENSYIQKSLYSYFPHPELEIINHYFEPLKQNEYACNKHSIILHLHNLRYINVSQTERVKKNIQSIVSDKDKFKKLLDLYKEDTYLRGEKKLDYFLDFQKNHYEKEKPKMKYFSNNKMNFLKDIQDLHEDIINTYESNSLIIAN